MPTLAWQSAARSRGDFGLGQWAAKALLLPVQLLLIAPSFLFLGTLTAMLLRHPDLRFYAVDRVAFAILLFAVVGRTVLLRQNLFIFERASWPMLGLTILAVFSVAGQPSEPEIWSLLASKFVVPFAMFHIAGLVFTSESRLRHFEVFSLVVLAYLTFTSIAFLCGAQVLIFPRFILNSDLGIHIDRARGPLLQAVANGVSLTLLALIALHNFMRAKARRTMLVLLLAAVPIAILATMTRAVWLSFGGAILAVVMVLRQQRSWRIWLAIATVVGGTLVLALNSEQLGSALDDRVKESGPVEFRQAIYAGSWQMFLQRPLTGWGFHQMPNELARHVTGYREKVLYPHNTYLEVLGEEGMVGFALYVWLMWELWKLRRPAVPPAEEQRFLDQRFHQLWPIMLGVYWFNAFVVVMSYQFVNALMFSIAGMLAAQRRRAEMEPTC